MKRIYLDYAATTPVDPLVKKAAEPYFSLKFGNPSSLHFFGQEAMTTIDESREKIAESIGADFREIIFTGSATEANNLALRGAIKASQLFSDGTGRSSLSARDAALDLSPRRLSASLRDQARRGSETFRTKTTGRPYRIIVSGIEHESVLETCRDLDKEGIEVIYLPVNREGIVDLKKLEELLNKQTVLVSIMYANNEIGTIQPIAEISKIIKNFRNESGIRNYELGKKNNIHNSLFMLHNSYPLLHTDAAQAFQYLDCDVNKLGVDLMTLSAHKIYGPKGIGTLYARALSPKPHPLSPIITGGGQEFGFRSGAENVPAIVGFAKAIKLVSNSRELENKRVGQLTNYFWKQIKKVCLKAELNRSQKNHLPNILNIYFPGKSAENLLIKLDLAGVAVSSGSACSTRASKPSHVLKSCGLPENRIKSSLRFSLGRPTTKTEIDEALKKIKMALSSSPVQDTSLSRMKHGFESRRGY